MIFLKAMTEFVFSYFDVEVIYGRVGNGNGASARVLEKGGYKFVGEEFGAEDDPLWKWNAGVFVPARTVPSGTDDGII